MDNFKDDYIKQYSKYGIAKKVNKYYFYIMITGFITLYIGFMIVFVLFTDKIFGIGYGVSKLFLNVGFMLILLIVWILTLVFLGYWSKLNERVQSEMDEVYGKHIFVGSTAEIKSKILLRKRELLEGLLQANNYYSSEKVKALYYKSKLERIEIQSKKKMRISISSIVIIAVISILTQKFMEMWEPIFKEVIKIYNGGSIAGIYLFLKIIGYNLIFLFFVYLLDVMINGSITFIAEDILTIKNDSEVEYEELLMSIALNSL